MVSLISVCIKPIKHQSTPRWDLSVCAVSIKNQLVHLFLARFVSYRTTAEKHNWQIKSHIFTETIVHTTHTIQFIKSEQKLQPPSTVFPANCLANRQPYKYTSWLNDVEKKRQKKKKILNIFKAKILQKKVNLVEMDSDLHQILEL